MQGNIIIDSKSKDILKKYDKSTNMQNEKYTSIIIVTYNHKPYTELCIESIRAFTPTNKYEIIVVDNNSSDGTLEYLKEEKDIKVIENEQNIGFAKSLNKAIDKAKGDNIVFLHNDTVVSPNWIYLLEQALYSNDSIGAVGPITNNCLNNQQITVNYTNINQMIEFSNKNYTSNKNKWNYKIKLIGFCWMVKKTVLDDVGAFDEIFEGIGYEDDDLSFRMICKDYKLLLCNDVFIHHFGGITKNNSTSLNCIEENRNKINDKWGFSIQYSTGIRLDLIDYINEDPQKEINVLEVGCGTGSSLLEIKSRYKNCNIYGLEICPNAGKLASHCADVIIDNIETCDLPYEKNFFDYIIFGDVLEHLYNPLETLKKVKQYINPKGFILASLPNIMHTSTIRALLNGRFHYEDAGILDRTHLRFFTLAEIQELFNGINFNIVDIRANAFYSYSDDAQFIDEICKLFGQHLRQQFSVYQYIIKTQNNFKLAILENEDITKLKLRLIRLENDIEIQSSLEDIFGMCNKYPDDFYEYLKVLIESNITNKIKVIKLLNKYGINNGFLDIEKFLGEI